MRLPFPLDLGRAAFSLALAVVLFFVAVNETNPEGTRPMDFPIPVEPVNLPPGLVVVDRPPPVRIRVRAPEHVFGRLRAESFSATVDAAGAKEGENDLPVIVTTTDTDVREVTPDQRFVHLRLEAVQERVLPVRVNLIGQVPSGYQLGQARADPERVTAVGASSLINRAVEAIVDVSVDRLTVSVNGAFTPRVLDERGNELRDQRVNPAAVNVVVPITQQTQYKEVGVRPRITGQPAPGYVLDPVAVNPPTATLLGEPAALEAASFVETQPVDVTGFTTTAVRQVVLVPPPRTLLVPQQGQIVTVTIRVSPLTLTQTLRVQPSVINLPPSLVLASPPGFVSVTITGPAPTLSGLSARDFRLVLDLSGRSGGRYDIEPRVENLPASMRVDKLDPPTVAVELRDAAPPPPPTPTPAPG